MTKSGEKGDRARRICPAWRRDVLQRAREAAIRDMAGQRLRSRRQP